MAHHLAAVVLCDLHVPLSPSKQLCKGEQQHSREQKKDIMLQGLLGQ
jgi:hypothetical protein